MSSRLLIFLGRLYELPLLELHKKKEEDEGEVKCIGVCGGVTIGS
jgi:hypothetical protein